MEKNQNNPNQGKNPKKTNYTKIQKETNINQSQENLKNLIEAIESSGLDEFMEYIRSPWKMFWTNLFAGIARWIGALVGAAIVIAIIGWILSSMINLPLIGAKIEPYIKEVQDEINKYTENTNYKENFKNMEKLLREIRDWLK